MGALQNRVQLITAEVFGQMPDNDLRQELIDGKVFEMSPPKRKHGRIAMRIGASLSNHVQQARLGETYAAETGFLLRRNPDTVRAPDASFVRRERLEGVSDEGYFEGAPDLVVEVLSPDDRASYAQTKALQWLDGGARMVIVLDPAKRVATIWRDRKNIRLLTDLETLEGEDVLPGWSLTLAELFGAE